MRNPTRPLGPASKTDSSYNLLNKTIATVAIATDVTAELNVGETTEKNPAPTVVPATTIATTTQMTPTRMGLSGREIR